MTRPVYETPADVENKLRLIKRIFPDRMVSPLPRSYHLDYLVQREGLQPVWVECKQRTVECGTYPDYMISLAKFMMGARLARETGGRFGIVVGWSDNKVQVADLSTMIPIPYRLGFGGRSDRSDAADQEPVIFIENRSFKTLDIVPIT